MKIKLLILIIAFPVGFFLIGRHYFKADRLLIVFAMWLVVCVTENNMTWFAKICVYICIFMVLYAFHFWLSTSIGKLLNNVYGVDW